MVPPRLVDVLLIPCPGILEPDLDHALAQPRDVSNPFQVLAVWVAVKLEVCLQRFLGFRDFS